MPPTLQDLRALLTTRFPERRRTQNGSIPTEVPPLDEALGGGVPLGRLTEWVASAPACGAQLALVQLLLACRRQNRRVALVDAADSFAPEVLPEGHREHLIWIRGGDLATSLAAADLLLHDGNLRLAVLDVRGVSEKQLRRWPATGWYRLQRAAEETGCALLCCTPCPLVPAAALRLDFESPLLRLEDRWRAAPELARQLRPTLARQQTAAEPQRAAG